MSLKYILHSYLKFECIFKINYLPPPKFNLLTGGRRTVKPKETNFRFPPETLTLSKTCTMDLFSEISIFQ